MNTPTQVITITNLAAKFARNKPDLKKILDRASVKPVFSLPAGRAGKTEQLFYSEVEACAAITAELTSREARRTAAAAVLVEPPKAHALAPDKDVKYLIGLIEQQQEVIRKLLVGQQQVFASVEAVARRVGHIVTELGVRE